MADTAIVGFFYVNSMKIKLRRIKVCKKKNPSCVQGMDRQIYLSGHSLASRGSASLGQPRDAKLWPSGQISLSIPDTHVKFLYYQSGQPPFILSLASLSFSNHHQQRVVYNCDTHSYKKCDLQSCRVESYGERKKMQMESWIDPIDKVDVTLNICITTTASRSNFLRCIYRNCMYNYNCMNGQQIQTVSVLWHFGFRVF